MSSIFDALFTISKFFQMPLKNALFFKGILVYYSGQTNPIDLQVEAAFFYQRFVRWQSRLHFSAFAAQLLTLFNLQEELKLKRTITLLLIIAVTAFLLIGCDRSGDMGVNNDTGASVNQEADNDTTASVNQETKNPSEPSVNQEENQVEENVDTAVITDVWTGKKLEITYNKGNCDRLSDDAYLFSVSVDTGEIFDVEFHADYTASSFYSEDAQVMAGAGLKASDLLEHSTAGTKVYGYESYDTASNSLYSCTLLHEVDGGILIVHNLDLGFSNEEIAKAYIEKVFISAKTAEDNTAGSDADTEESGKKLAVTKEEKEAVYQADYERVKDKIASSEEKNSEICYYDANGSVIMSIYGRDVSNVFFHEYYDSGVKKYSKIYTFDESGTYGVMELEFHENGERKTETVYNDDGSKIVFSFDENGDYVSGTEYDKDGNIVD